MVDGDRFSLEEGECRTEVSIVSYSLAAQSELQNENVFYPFSTNKMTLKLSRVLLTANRNYIYT